MSEKRVYTRIQSCISVIRRLGPSSAKKIGHELGYGPSWAYPFLERAQQLGWVTKLGGKPALFDLAAAHKEKKNQALISHSTLESDCEVYQCSHGATEQINAGTQSIAMCYDHYDQLRCLLKEIEIVI
jgi:hypothetical protein